MTQKEIENLLKGIEKEIAEKAAAHILANLSSAYQEEAIESTAEYLEEYDNAQMFADDCCENYRLILKAAGFGGSAVYKGFRAYGDETELNAAALDYYQALKGSEKADGEKKQVLTNVIKSLEDIKTNFNK